MCSILVLNAFIGLLYPAKTGDRKQRVLRNNQSLLLTKKNGEHGKNGGDDDKNRAEDSKIFLEDAIGKLSH